MNMDLNLAPPSNGPILHHEEVCDMVTLIQNSFKPRQKMKNSNFFCSNERLQYPEYVALDPKFNKL